VSEPVKRTFKATDAGSEDVTDFDPFDRIGQKKKRHFPLARAEGTILQMFPGL
jgi:hypothetical protein